MNAKRRPARFLWAVGLVVLLASAVGATVVLNASQPGGAGHGSTESAAAADDELVVALGYADVEPGVSHLNPVLAGQVTEVAREGNSYRQGDLLLHLDDKEARLRLAEAEKDLALAKERLRQAETNPKEELDDKIALQELAVKVAREHATAAEAGLKVVKYETGRKLQPRIKVPPAEALVREAKARLEVEQKKLDQLKRKRRDMDRPAEGEKTPETGTDDAKLARRVVALRQVQVDLARSALKDFELRAPIAGSALRVLARRGEVVGPQRSPAAIQFCPAGPRIIRAEVDQEYASLVHEGAAVTVVDDSSAGPRWEGRVTRMSDWYTRRRSIVQEPKVFNDVRTLECNVAIELRPGDKAPRIGQRVRVRIKTPSRRIH
jgi:multidrug resistance efflux pump